MLKFERATKTDLFYQGTINGKTYVVPHSYDHHGTIKAMRHDIVVHPGHVASNNKGFTPEEITRVHQHIKHIHGGQEAKKLEERTISFGSMKFNKIANTKSVTYNSFGKVVKEEGMIQEHVWDVTDHLGNKHSVEAKDHMEAKKKAVSVGGIHPQGIPMSHWSRVRVVRKDLAESTKSKMEESMELDESFMRTYNRNEDANRHTDNLVHLAKHFGTKADHAQAKFFKDEHTKHGHNIHHEAAYKLHEKLWPSAVAAHNHVKEEVEQIDELKKSTLKNYIKGASQSLVTHAHISARAREHERTERNAGHPIAQDHFRKGAEAYEKKTDRRLVGVQRAAKKLEENMSPDKKKADAKAHKELWNTPAMSDADFNKRYPLPSEKKKARMNWHKHGGKLFREEEHSDTFNTVKTVIHEALRKNLRSQSDIDKFARRGRAAKNLLGLPQSLKWPKPIAGVPNGGKTGTDTLKEAVSRKDFQMAAALIKANPNATDRQTLANHHAHVFAQSNPQFDHAKFHAAAGTQYSHISNQDN